MDTRRRGAVGTRRGYTDLGWRGPHCKSGTARVRRAHVGHVAKGNPPGGVGGRSRRARHVVFKREQDLLNRPGDAGAAA